MKAIKFVRATLSPASNNLKQIEKDLNLLQKEVQEISNMDNYVEGMVRLFKVVSPIQDKGGFYQVVGKLEKKNYGQIDHIISALKTLNVHIEEAGRCEYGYNRTLYREEVTPDKVLLGGVYGLNTNTASFWLARKEKLEKEPRPDWSKYTETPASNWYLINDCHAGGFVKSHTKGMLKALDQINNVKR